MGFINLLNEELGNENRKGIIVELPTEHQIPMMNHSSRAV